MHPDAIEQGGPDQCSKVSRRLQCARWKGASQTTARALPVHGISCDSAGHAVPGKPCPPEVATQPMQLTREARLLLSRDVSAASRRSLHAAASTGQGTARMSAQVQEVAGALLYAAMLTMGVYAAALRAPTSWSSACGGSWPGSLTGCACAAETRLRLQAHPDASGDNRQWCQDAAPMPREAGQ